MESWKRKLRMGMVGGGPDAFIGAVHRTAAAIGQQTECVAGCFSRDYKNTKKTGKELYLKPARCYRTYQEMAEKEAALPENERIDFVSVVTPNKSHYPIAKAFLQKGFHVVCDKPMTYSLREAQELVKLVEKTGLVFALTHNYTGHPLVRHARELFRSGKMGGVRKVIIEYLQDFLAQPLEKLGQKQASWRQDPKQAGIGGTLGDIGIHGFNLFEFITGDPVAAVCADKTGFLPGRKLDDDVNILLRLKGGGKGLLTASQVATGEDNGLKIRIYGTGGAVIWAQENPNYLEVLHSGKPRQIFSRGHAEYLSKAAADCTRIPPGHPEGYLEAFATIYDGAVRAIRAHIKGKPLPAEKYEFPSVYDGLRGMEFISAAVQSSKRNSAWIKM